MTDRPVPLALPLLGKVLLGEATSRATVLGVPVSLFPRLSIDGPASVDLFGRRLASPLGPAAGPHTQLSQNVLLSYLCGARFIELKTAQARDDIEVSKPCIDVLDLGLNCEWSQELRLAQTVAEYLKAELLVHMARCEILGQSLDVPSDFAFNVSVGYDLKGLTSRRMRAYIRSLKQPCSPLRERLAAELRSVWSLASDAASLPPAMTSLTLSTMHGCPSQEIEAIATFLLEEHGLPLLLKLNPTVLGKRRLRGLLYDELGYTQLVVPDEAFDHDPSLDEALDVVRSVRDRAERLGLSFAVKLTNTLEIRRPAFSRLHTGEAFAYLSGRALFPLMLSVAALLRDELGPVPLSAAGGMDAANIALARSAGLLPLTVCTDLLRPGGYGRLAACIDSLERSPLSPMSLSEAAAMAAMDPRYFADWRRMPVKPQRALTSFDCNAAPCSLACPTDQQAPRYLREYGNGDPTKALVEVLERNPLPAITGHVCPAPCESTCVRGYTGEPIAIREIKRFTSNTEVRPEPCPDEIDTKVAIVGAGPSGLATAAFLSREGVRVKLLERGREVGGVPARAIPEFRLPLSALNLDASRVLEHPLVDIELGVDPLASGGIARLFDEGFAFVVLATGAGPGRRLRLPQEDLPGVIDGLCFLETVRRKETVILGNRVFVVGGGSSAIDAARTARRLVGERGTVELLYRRSRKHMPAHAEELVLAEREGVILREQCVPLRFEGNMGALAGLWVARTVFESTPERRGVPVPVAGSEQLLEATAVIVAIGQTGVPLTDMEVTADGRVVTSKRCRCSLPRVYAVGDARRGPSTIVEAIADARAAAEDIIERICGSVAPESSNATGSLASLLEHKARSSERRPTDLVLGGQREAQRCLSCDVLCGLCAEVCPNRANVVYETVPRTWRVFRLESHRGKVRAVESEPLTIRQRFQIANLGEPCNACGNCATFCPSNGAPYLDKPRLWLGMKPKGERGIELRRTPHGWRARWDSALGIAKLTKRGESWRLVCGSFRVRLGADLFVEKVTYEPSRGTIALDLREAAEVAAVCEAFVASASYWLEASSIKTRSGVRGTSYTPSGKRDPVARMASSRAKKAPIP